MSGSERELRYQREDQARGERGMTAAEQEARMVERLTSIGHDRTTAEHGTRIREGMQQAREERGMTKTETTTPTWKVELSPKAASLIASIVRNREVDPAASFYAEAWVELVEAFPAQLASSIRSEARTRFLRDVMITAIEGGTGYWAMADKVQRSGTAEQRKELAFDWHYESYVLIEGEDGTDECQADGVEGKCAGHLVNADVIERGMGLLAATKLDPEIKRSLLAGIAENDGGEVDALGADVLVQLGVFGTVVYG